MSDLRALVLLTVASCATVPPVTLPPRPPAVDLSAVVPPVPKPEPIPTTVARYPDRAVHGGEFPGLPRGILVSPAVYAEQVEVIGERDRLARENEALRQLVDALQVSGGQFADQAEAAAHQLEQRALTAERWGPWKFWGGVAVGAAVMVGAAWVAGRGR